MGRLKETLLEAAKNAPDALQDKVEVVGFSIASCLNRAAQHWNIELTALDYTILERGKQSLFRTKPYRLQVHLLPEEERFADLEEFSVSLGVGHRLLNKDLAGMDAVQDIDGRVIVRNYFRGVFLRVFPPKNNGKAMQREDVAKALYQAGVDKFDEMSVTECMNEATGEAVRIGHFTHQSENDATCRVEISPDHMKAFVYTTAPGPKGRHLESNDIVAVLKAHLVVCGYKEKEIEEALLQDLYQKPILAAEGQAPQRGKDAAIDYKVNVKRNILHLKQDALGRVDFKNLNIIENVVVGQLLAEKIPAQKGKPGLTVFNRIVEPKHGKDIDLRAGKGTILSEDGTKLTAQTNGQVVLTRGRICVEPVYRVIQDVGPKTGNIHFLGSVVVGGAVLDGFEIKAAGNVEVHGGVQRARIEAEGDIVVRAGVQGSHIESTGGNVVARYIQDANINAPANVLVADGILRSKVAAGDSIICNGRRAQIVGGYLIAAKEIYSRLLGSTAYTNTRLTVGLDPLIVEAYENNKQLSQKVAAQITSVKQSLTILLSRRKAGGAGFSEKQAAILAQKQSELRQLEREQADAIKQTEKLKLHFLKASSNSKVHAERQIFPGVEVHILQAKQKITDTYNAVTLSYENGYVKMDKLERKKQNLPSYHKWRSR